MKGDKSKEICKMGRKDGKRRRETELRTDDLFLFLQLEDSNIGDGFWNGESMAMEFEAEKFVGNGVVIDSVVWLLKC